MNEEVVRESEYVKVVKIVVDGATGEELYEHMGKGKNGIEWHTGLLVVEASKVKEGAGNENE